MTNRILGALSHEDRTALVPYLERVRLKKRYALEAAGKRITHVYFVETGIAAVICISKSVRVAVGLIGCEGASGIAVILGNDRSPHSSVMLTDGTALRISVADLRDAMARQPNFDRLLARFSLAFYNQAAHTALSNATSTVVQRVARWVLMTHDRVPSRTIPLTHDIIGLMLGVRRAGVTEALDALRSDGLIEIRRGAVLVLDRPAIEKIAGHFYGMPEKEYVRLIGTPWPPVEAKDS